MSNAADRKTSLVGFWFHVDVDGHDVWAYGSSWSGKEEVWVDGECILDTRSFRNRTTHNLTIGDQQCDVMIGYDNVLNHLKGTLSLEIRNGDTVLSKQTESVPVLVMGGLYGLVVFGTAFILYDILG